MIKHDIRDAALTSTVEVGTTAAKTTTGGVFDGCQNGGVDECNLVIEMPALTGSGATVTLTVQSCETPDGTFTDTSLSVTGSATAPVAVRERFPLAAKRYLRLKAVTGSTAPTAAVVACLTLRV